MTVAFPGGYNLDRESTFEWDSGTEIDELEGGDWGAREFGGQWLTLTAKFKYLTLSEADTLQAFMLDNAGDEITWTIDGIHFIGTLKGKVRKTMIGPRFTIVFKFYARVNS